MFQPSPINRTVEHLIWKCKFKIVYWAALSIQSQWTPSPALSIVKNVVVINMLNKKIQEKNHLKKASEIFFAKWSNFFDQQHFKKENMAIRVCQEVNKPPKN